MPQLWITTASNTTTAGTWVGWNNVFTQDTGTATAGTNLIWGGWNIEYMTTATSTNTVTILPAWGNWNNAYVETKEQREERIAAEETRRRVAEYERLHREEEAKAAQERAHLLLTEQLSAAQKQEYQEKRRFRVIARDGREFLLTKGFSWNAFELKDGKKVRTFCVHPRIAVPDEDVLISQKLMLETDPDAFVALANKQELHDQVAVA